MGTWRTSTSGTESEEQKYKTFSLLTEIFQFLLKEPGEVHLEPNRAWKPVQEVRAQVPDVRGLLSEQAKV